MVKTTAANRKNVDESNYIPGEEQKHIDSVGDGGQSKAWTKAKSSDEHDRCRSSGE